MYPLAFAARGSTGSGDIRIRNDLIPGPIPFFIEMHVAALHAHGICSPLPVT